MDYGHLNFLVVIRSISEKNIWTWLVKFIANYSTYYRPSLSRLFFYSQFDTEVETNGMVILHIFFFIKIASWFYLKSLRSQYQNEWINESKLKLCIAALLIYLPFLFSGAFMLLLFYDVCVIFFGFIHIFRSSFTSAMGSSRYHFLLYISIPDSQKITVKSGSTWYASDPSQFLYCVNLLSSKK